MKKLLLLPGVAALLFANASLAQPGAPDPSFGGGDGFTTTSFLTEGHANANAVAIQPNGRIVAAGEAWIPDGTASGMIALARYMPNGSLDPTFDSDGRAYLALANYSISASDVQILPNGKILVCGGAWNDNQGLFLLARFNADGSPDTGFDGDGIVTTKVGIAYEYFYAMALQSDGKIVAVGYVNLSGYIEVAVLRYNANGTLDNSFGGGDGIVSTPTGESDSQAQDVVIQPDGKILAAGYAVANGYKDFALLRYNANGTPDNSFGGFDGQVTLSLTSKNDQATNMVLQPDGKIVLAGPTGNVNDDSMFGAARFNANGTPDNSFDGDGVALVNINDHFESVSALALQPDGKILLGGCSQQPVGNSYIYDFALIRLGANGQRDFGFGNNGIATLATSPSSDFMYAMTMQPDGKIVAAGNARLGDYNSFSVARFLSGITVGTANFEENNFNLRVFPNPVGENSALEYELSDAARINIRLYDAGGRLIKTFATGLNQAAGKYRMPLGASDWPNGVYFLRVESGEAAASIKIMKQF